jgi:transposase-like protein
VVSEIESGRLTIAEAQKLYDIGGSQTIPNWIKKFGKTHLLGKVVRIETTDEVNQLKTLEKENHRLESALAQAHLKIVALEGLIEEADSFYDTDIKKNFGMKA